VRVTAGTNFHTVIPDRVYRSAQLNDGTLRQIVKDRDIRTVINLRGCCPQFLWYRQERETLEELGVAQMDINFSSTLVPSVTAMRQLVDTLSTCEYPVLLHCRRGADRTGLAAAVAVLLDSEANPGGARGQLSWRYGHVASGRSGDLHLVLDMYQVWLAQEGKLHHPELLRRWADEHYLPGPFWAAIEPLEVPARLEFGKPAAARFRVHNRSHFPWQFKQGANCGMHLRYLLRTEDRQTAYLGGAGFFEQTLLPGESLELTLSLPAVRKPGRYHLLVDMAEEAQCWFFLVGSPPFETELIVGRE
jgi:protein tyrosine phosphatase (PTP) superfamily phosphohydrolase (DUF442 family)